MIRGDPAVATADQYRASVHLCSRLLMTRSRLPRFPDAASQNASTSIDGCTGCADFDRRGFLTTASLVSLGLLVAACGDGTIGGPTDTPGIALTPLRVDPKLVPALADVGGRAVVLPVDGAPIVVERLTMSKYRAFLLACPHKGTTVGLTSDGFLCPNHGARFSRDGLWRGGQETSDLVPIGVAVQADGALLVGGLAAAELPPALILSTKQLSYVVAITGADPVAQNIALTNGGDGALFGLSVALTYGGDQPSGWLTMALSQSVAPAAISVTARRGALVAGTYTANIFIRSAVTAETQSVSVSLIVQDPSKAAALQLSASALAFTASSAASPVAQTVQLLNSGGGVLNGLGFAVTYGNGATGWLSASMLSATTAPATLTVRPITTALGIGTYTATVLVSGNGVTARAITVTVTIATLGIAITIANFPALANVGGAAGSVGVVNGGPVALVRASATTFVAFSMRCTHAGTTVRVENYANSGSAFHCPNHGALFSNSGAVLASSPIRTSPLTMLQVSYKAGEPVLYISP